MNEELPAAVQDTLHEEALTLAFMTGGGLDFADIEPTTHALSK